MSYFEVKVVPIKALEPIEGADAIEAAVIGDYRSVVQKGSFQVGDLAVYIPEGAVVPDSLLESMGLTGKLAGRHKNRVKAIKLRGCLSQGLILKLHFWDGGQFAGGGIWSLTDGGDAVKEGDDVAEILGIVKYEPIIPPSMAGDQYYAGHEYTVKYDIENFKKYPDVLVEGEEVVMTEKLHGTYFCIGLLPDSDFDPKHIFGKYVLFSKGIGAQGLSFKLSPKTEQTVYLRAAEKYGLFQALETLKSLLIEENNQVGFDRPLFIMGEVFGGNIQDNGWYSNDISFRMFDMATGYNAPGLQTFFDYDVMVIAAKIVDLDVVPLLYRGPFSKEIMLQHTTGTETVSGKDLNMREGLVVKPVKERDDPKLGRVILKSVSEQYLLRKNGVEFN